MLNTLGVIDSTKISGNFGPKLYGSVWSNQKSFKKTGLSFEVDHLSRSAVRPVGILVEWIEPFRPLKATVNVVTTKLAYRTL